ncbi:MAG: hypothetical protein J4G00_01940 [Actinomycetia bacterium]|nr:hypothetical protein [Actinomycetes bacterium]
MVVAAAVVGGDVVVGRAGCVEVVSGRAGKLVVSGDGGAEVSAGREESRLLSEPDGTLCAESTCAPPSVTDGPTGPPEPSAVPK